MLTSNPTGGYIQSHTPVDLILSGKQAVTLPATLKSGIAYKAGTVLGKILAGAATSATKAGGNTGTGTFVIDATNPTRIGAKVGVYTLRCVSIAVASNNDAVFELKDPDGFVVKVAAIPTGGGGAVTIDEDIKGALTDGGTNFIIGDGFDITVPAGSGKLTTSLAAAQDGSAVPFAILAQDVDASGADKAAPVYVEGIFNEEALVYGTGHTADTVRNALRDVGIHIQAMKYSG